MVHDSKAIPVASIELHGFVYSGHCHRVQLLLSLLNLPFVWVPVNLKLAEQKTDAFKQLNAFGQVPVIRDGDVVLADSNAILVYLAKKYAPDTWLPEDAELAARVQVWLSQAAGPLAFGPAAARAHVLFGRPVNQEEVNSRSHALLQVMNGTLAETPYLVGKQPTLADIAMYTYVAHAPEGNIELTDYPAVGAWLKRIEALPGFVAMPPASSMPGKSA